MTRVGELEAAVMHRLWAANEPQTVRQVLESLSRERELAYTTVMTVMERLLRKGLLDRRPVGKAYAYEPTISRADHTAEMMAEALRDSDDRSGALVHFAQRLTTEERAALRSALTSSRRRSEAT